MQAGAFRLNYDMPQANHYQLREVCPDWSTTAYCCYVGASGLPRLLRSSSFLRAPALDLVQPWHTQLRVIWVVERNGWRLAIDLFCHKLTLYTSETFAI